MKARIQVMLKESVLDPQGNAITNALHNLNFDEALSVRQGKIFEITLKDLNKETALSKLHAMCEALLVNMIIEEYQIDIL